MWKEMETGASGGGGGTADLLWDNPNKNTGKGATTFTQSDLLKSLSNYTHILVYSKAQATVTPSTDYEIGYSLIPIDGNSYYAWGGVSSSSARYRSYQIINSTIVMGNGIYSGTASENACLPLQIFGVNLTLASS